MKREFDLKYFGLSVVLLVGFWLTHDLTSSIINCIKIIITYKKLGLIAGAVSTIFTVLPKIKDRKITFSSKMSFKEFRASVGDIISFIDNPIVLVGSLSLLKGIVIYYTENNRYFPLFNNYEISLIFLVSIYLLITSLIELWKNIFETCSKLVTPSGNPQADISKENSSKEIPKPEN